MHWHGGLSVNHFLVSIAFHYAADRGADSAGGFSVGSVAGVEQVGARGTSTGEILVTGACCTIFARDCQ